MPAFAPLRGQGLGGAVVEVPFADAEQPCGLGGEVFDENTDRDKAISAGLELLSHCSYIYFSTHADAARSQGMKKEREYANELGLTELDFSQNQTSQGLFEECL